MVPMELYIGRKATGISVRPDGQWPGMWRIHHDQRVSDMVNLARAKDAAVSWANLPGGAQGKLVNWRYTKTARDGH